MTDLPRKLRLKAMAEEDIYFAKRDRELIKALHRQRLADSLKIKDGKARKKAKALQRRYAQVTVAHADQPWKLADLYRRLIKKARKLIAKSR